MTADLTPQQTRMLTQEGLWLCQLKSETLSGCDGFRKKTEGRKQRAIGMSNVKDIVMEKYSETARRPPPAHGGTSCCGSAPCRDTVDPITSGLYDEAQKAAFRKRLCWLPLAAAILPVSRS